MKLIRFARTRSFLIISKCIGPIVENHSESSANCNIITCRSKKTTASKTLSQQLQSIYHFIKIHLLEVLCLKVSLWVVDLTEVWRASDEAVYRNYNTPRSSQTFSCLDLLTRETVYIDLTDSFKTCMIESIAHSSGFGEDEADKFATASSADR